MIKKFIDLQKEIVLSELTGYINGRFCVVSGKGASLVMLSTYIIDNGHSANYPHEFVFKAEPDFASYCAHSITGMIIDSGGAFVF